MEGVRWGNSTSVAQPWLGLGSSECGPCREHLLSLRPEGEDAQGGEHSAGCQSHVCLDVLDDLGNKPSALGGPQVFICTTGVGDP